MEPKNTARLWVAERAVAYITDAYAGWRRTGGREPSITATEVWEFLHQSGQPRDYSWLTKARQRLLVWSVLEGLRGKGTLGSSQGISSMTGRPARCYEPPQGS